MRALARTIVIVVALVVAGSWLLESSPSFQTCVQEKQQQSGNGGFPKNIPTLLLLTRNYRDCLVPVIHDSHNEILAAFTIVLAVATIFLWFTTSDLVRGAENTARRQLRAYVGIEHVTLRKVAAGQKPEITVRLKNFGQTPAYNVVHWMDMAVADIGTTKLVVDRKEGDDRTIIDPSHGFSVRSTRENNLTVEEAIAIFDDEKRLYFTGRIRYKDAFGRRRKTYFRLETHGKALIDEGLMATSKTGNRAT